MAASPLARMMPGNTYTRGKITSLLTLFRGLLSIVSSVLNVKALVGSFNEEKALVGAVIYAIKRLQLYTRWSLE